MSELPIQHLVISGGSPPPLTACGLDKRTVTHMVFGPPVRVDLIPPALARIDHAVCPDCAHACGIGR